VLDSTRFLIAGGTALLCSATLFFYYLRSKRLLDEMWSVQTYEATELKRLCTDDFDAIVEVQGAVSCDKPVLSPVGQVPCCWLRVRVRREQSKNGNLIGVMPVSQRTSIKTELLQTSASEIGLLRDAVGKIHAARYSGMTNFDRFQYFCMEGAKINPSVARSFANGKQILPMTVLALNLSDETGYSVPTYYLAEARRQIRTPDLNLWLNPRGGLNAATARILDISGFARHGLLSAGYGTMWQYTAGATPERFVRFDSPIDAVDFGSILNDDASADFALDLWLKFPGSAGTQEEVLAKKALVSDNTAGYAIYRNASNQIVFRIGSGSASVTVTTAATVTTTWTHYAILIDRNGNAQAYINGVASGSAASVSAIATGTNALSLYLGRDGTNYGQVDLGDVRIYSFGAGLLPAADFVLSHYTGEKAYFGL
jgi:hypothetical protein